MHLNYTPHPIDTSNVVLPPEIVMTLEEIAANNHDIWAQNRIRDGWSYGKVRDDLKKETPCLVPYDILPESEKKYDRKTATEIVKVLIKLGYKLVPPTEIATPA